MLLKPLGVGPFTTETRAIQSAAGKAAAVGLSLAATVLLPRVSCSTARPRARNGPGPEKPRATACFERSVSYLLDLIRLERASPMDSRPETIRQPRRRSVAGLDGKEHEERSGPAIRRTDSGRRHHGRDPGMEQATIAPG